jgi:hypothetical protein
VLGSEPRTAQADPAFNVKIKNPACGVPLFGGNRGVRCRRIALLEPVLCSTFVRACITQVWREVRGVSLIHNERTKLLALAFNTAATSAFTVGGR